MTDNANSGGPADTGAMTQWAAAEQSSFQQVVETDQGEAQVDEGRGRHWSVGLGRWGGALRQAEESLGSTAAQQDEDDAVFAGQMAHDVASGAIAPPPGGPLTPEEIHEVETHPWPNHTMLEAVERLREQRATGTDTSPTG